MKRVVDDTLNTISQPTPPPIFIDTLSLSSTTVSLFHEQVYQFHSVMKEGSYDAIDALLHSWNAAFSSLSYDEGLIMLSVIES